jgi:glycosyltransferase involved in cell wall biosynthesis
MMTSASSCRPAAVVGTTIHSAPKRLAIISTHPIQYHAHWFRALAARPEIDLSVFYCYHASPADQAQAGFGVEFEWDIPLLEGYRYTFLNGARGKPRKFFALGAPQIGPILTRENFDAAMVNGWHYKAAWQAIFACWSARVPVMVRGDSQLATPRGPLTSGLKYPIYRAFVPRFDACLAVGSRSRQYYLHYGARPERVFFVPHAIQDDLFQRAAADAKPRRQMRRRQWGFQEHHTVFLFSGKFIEKKRPMDFLQALDAAVRQQPRVAGVMVGDGPLRAGCEQFVNHRRLPVRFTGFVNQSRIVDAYLAADCLVLPSDGRETWGLVVNEAMSCSLPCLVSDAVGCAPDLVHEGLTGATFPVGDVKILSELLARHAANPAVLISWGKLARQRVADYSLNAAVEGLLMALAAVGQTKRGAE